MSRGLGAIERRVIKEASLPRGIFEEGGMYGVDGLARAIDHEWLLARAGLVCDGSIQCCHNGPWSVGPDGKFRVSSETLEGVRRAVRSLKRKGLVKAEYMVNGTDDRPPRLYRRVSLTEAGRDVLDRLVLNSDAAD